MIIQMITGNQSKAVNDLKIHSSVFLQRHGTIAAILIWNDYDVTSAIKMLKKD